MNDDSGGDVEFLDSFSGLHDPRQQAKVLYPLPEILLLCLCAVLGGADSWVEVALYGQQKLEFLRRFLPFAHGTPSHDQLGNVFARLCPLAYESDRRIAGEALGLGNGLLRATEPLREPALGEPGGL